MGRGLKGPPNELQMLRLAEGLDRKQAAQLIGTEVTSLIHWEAGDWMPSPKYIPRIAVAYKVTPREVIEAASEVVYGKEP